MRTYSCLSAAVLLSILGQVYAEDAAPTAWRAVEPYTQHADPNGAARADASAHGEVVRSAMAMSKGGSDVRRDGVERRGRAASRTLALRQETTGGRLAKRVNGTVSYLQAKSKIYILDVEIGDPPVSYPLQLDTASADLLVLSSACDTKACPRAGGAVKYDLAVSTTAAAHNSTVFNASFADGSFASGHLATDAVWLGGGVDGLPGQAIGLINQSSIDWAGEGTSGILGLGFSRLSLLARAGLGEAVSANASTSSINASATASASSSTRNATTTTSSASSAPTYLPPPLERLVSLPDSLPYPVFGLALANATGPYSAKTANATLTLGGVCEGFVLDDTQENADSGRTISDIEWYPVVPFAPASQTAMNASQPQTSSATGATGATAAPDSLVREEYLFWALPLANFSVGNTSVKASPTYNASYTAAAGQSTALLDVGFNGISGPQQDVIALFSLIQDARQVSNGQWAVPCDNNMSLSFVFARADGQPGRPIVLEPSDWLIGQVADTSMCLSWPIASPPSADGIDWSLGTPFLAKTYSIFSTGINGVQAPMVGFLPLPDRTNRSMEASVNTSSISMTATTSASAAGTPLASLLTTSITTQLPNVLLPDPTYSTPTYAFETSSIPSLGEAPTAGAANASLWPSPSAVPVVQSGISSPVRNTTSRAGATGSGGSNGASMSGGQTARALASRCTWLSLACIAIAMSCSSVMI